MARATTTEVQKKKQAPPPPLPTSKAMATREVAAAPALPPGELNDWGVPALTSKDIMIPKIFVMQPGSGQVTEGNAKFGEFRDSLNQSLMGDVNNPIELVPILMEKTFVVMELKDAKFEFKTQFAITPENENSEFEQTSPEGKTQKWYRTLNCYVLIPSEVEAGTAIPYLVSFRSTSSKAGQKLSTTMYMKNLKAGKTPASTVVELSAKKDSNAKGTFAVMDIKEKRASTPQEVTEAFQWVKTIRAGQVKVDHSDLVQDATTSQAMPESTEY